MRGRLFGFLVPMLLVAFAVGMGLLWHPHAALPPALASSTSPQSTLSTSKTRGLLHEGETLFAESCSSCHGATAGGSAVAPKLVGLGPATVDLWLSNGWMPLASTNVAQPPLKPPAFSPAQIRAIVAYVASLGPGGPGIPRVDLKGANVAEGFSLFALNCAACHTVTGAGDALTNGAYAPSLHAVTPTQVAEALRTGPLQMPVFSSHQLSRRQVDDIVAYVMSLHHPNDRGGVPLGWIGPVTEGFVALLFGVGSLMLVAFWVGGRHRDEEA